MIQGVSISEMFAQSMTVLTKPSIASFEQYEKRGGMREALTYVGVAAAAAAIVSFVFGLLGGIGSAIGALIIGFISPILGFLIFAFALYFVAQAQGGTGTQDEVLYTVSLYAAPIQAVTGAVSAIPILNCLALPVTLALALYQAYLAYLATRASMNVDQTKGIISVVAAIVIQIVVVGIIIGVLTGILAALHLASRGF